VHPATVMPCLPAEEDRLRHNLSRPADAGAGQPVERLSAMTSMVWEGRIAHEDAADRSDGTATRMAKETGVPAGVWIEVKGACPPAWPATGHGAQTVVAVKPAGDGIATESMSCRRSGALGD